jgi:lipopolysaccharide/colanic/teichoic acid biosynthesis glycosyltransferase
MQIAAFFIMLEIAFSNNISQEVIDSHLFPFIIVFCIWLFIFFLFNLYDAQSIKPTIPNLRKIGIASIVALTASTVLFYIIPTFGITPKTNLIIFSIIFLFLFFIWRRIFYKIFAVYFQKSVVFVIDKNRDGNYAQELINYMRTYPQSGFSVLGFYASIKEFMENSSTPADILIVSKNTLTDGQEMKLIYNNIENILDLTYAYENILGKIPVDSIDETWFLHNIRNTSETLYNKIAYLFNVIFIIMIFIITSPILLITAIFIKLEDKGPIFYTQLRVGKRGKIFKLYKLRSMIVDADKGGAEWTEKNDGRITKIGKIIRKLHIDEIPQLLNIIRREMVLVGPRPEIPSFEDKLRKEIPHYGLRHIITPGFTGWAQIKWRNARGITESKEKFEYDLYYIKNRNVFMDLGIILKTVQIIFTH